MKVLTFKISESYIEAMEKLVGEDRIYASRSELVRESVRQYLHRELKKLGKIELPKITIIPNWEYKTGNLKISKINPNVIFITGFGLTQKVENPSLN